MRSSSSGRLSCCSSSGGSAGILASAPELDPEPSAPDVAILQKLMTVGGRERLEFLRLDRRLAVRARAPGGPMSQRDRRAVPRGPEGSSSIARWGWAADGSVVAIPIVFRSRRRIMVEFQQFGPKLPHDPESILEHERGRA